MSRKPTFKIPPSVMETGIQPKNVMGGLSKWIPLICAGTAIGVSMFALKEIKNTRKELINLKKEQYTAPNNDKLEKKIELLEKQLSKISDFLKTNQMGSRNIPPKYPTRQQKPEIVKTVVTPPVEVKIINDEPDEYEEVEVTDDEE